MTTEEIIKFIRAHIEVEDLEPCFGAEKYQKGYIRGMITMASVQQIINLETEKQLLAELDAAMLQALQNTMKNTDQTDI